MSRNLEAFAELSRFKAKREEDERQPRPQTFPSLECCLQISRRITMDSNGESLSYLQFHIVVIVIP